MAHTTKETPMNTLMTTCFALSLAIVPVLSAAAPPSSKVKVLMTQALADMPGKEGMMLEVTLPPGGADNVHRHDAHVFVYMLEGSAVMQVQGGKSVTLKPGQTFYESPSDIHVVGKNASGSKPAKFLAVFVKDANKPPVQPAK
jgi:quercetin dioxygenase-like cupin family protein